MTTLRVTHIREVFAAVAYQLGFTPRHSLVVVALHGHNRRIGLVARVDLHAADTTATTLAQHLRTSGADAALVIAYTHDPDLAHDATVFLDDTLHAAAITPVGTWWVTDTDYRAINPQRPEHCPDHAQPLDLDLDTTVVAATLVAEGATVRPRREDLAITPAPEAARAEAHTALLSATTNTTGDRAAGLALWRSTLTTTDPTPTQAGTLAAAMTDVLVRDAILCDLIPGGTETATALVTDQHTPTALNTLLGTVLAPGGVRPDPDTTRRAETLLTHVAAHTESPAALTLLAFLAWWAGNGATANVHIDTAQTLDPTYRLAVLLREILDHGMPPGWIARHR